MSMPRIIARNICSNWANMAVSMVIGFFMMPFFVHRLGDTLYGTWTLVVSLVGGNLLDVGVRSSVVKYVSPRQATHDRDRLRNDHPGAVYGYRGACAFLCRRDFGYA